MFTVFSLFVQWQAFSSVGIWCKVTWWFCVTWISSGKFPPCVYMLIWLHDQWNCLHRKKYLALHGVPMRRYYILQMWIFLIADVQCSQSLCSRNRGYFRRLPECYQKSATLWSYKFLTCNKSCITVWHGKKNPTWFGFFCVP